MKKIHFEIQINANKDKVWDIMLSQATYREWTSAFNPGSYYEGSWEQGSKINFIGPDPKTGELGGMVSEIEESRKPDFVSIKHLGMLVGGKEITDGPMVEGWAGAHENYTFTEVDGGTKVFVELDVNDDFEKEMSEMWPKALERLKEICEK